MTFPMNMEITIPQEDPVRLVSAQLEELDYRKLYRAYSSQGRKSAAEPRILFEVLVYGYLCGIYSTRKLEEACRKRVDFMWLLQGEPVPDYSTFARFRTGRTKDTVEDLFYQFVRRLEEMGETEHDEVFIDGTKIESRANRYTFVWRKTTEKHLGKVREAVRQEYFQTTAYYRCEDCSGCPCREACCKAKDDSPKELRIQTDLLRLSGRSQRNIETERGITLRVNRSIQVEGAFGVLKIQTFPYLRPG
ncbi:protein of unknown function [Ruminococcaceae bacterium BL-6]|nr:protein of unknown function [Ruminococcaceae bacterium BL-6]